MKTYFLCVLCDHAIEKDGENSDICPSCNQRMRVEIAERPPKPLITTSILKKVSAWSGGADSLRPEELESLGSVLKNKEKRLSILKNLISIKQGNRIVKLLGLAESIENTILHPENFKHLEAKDQLKALSLCHESIREAKSFLYDGKDEENEILEILVSEKRKQDETVSPAAREVIKKLISPLLKEKKS